MCGAALAGGCTEGTVSSMERDDMPRPTLLDLRMLSQCGVAMAAKIATTYLNSSSFSELRSCVKVEVEVLGSRP